MVPHYKWVVSNCYEKVSNWWYANALALSFIVYNSLVGTHHIQISCYSIQYFLWWSIIVLSRARARFSTPSWWELMLQIYPTSSLPFKHLLSGMLVGFCVGVNSSITSFFDLGFFAQYFLRKYCPRYLLTWDHLASTALDGETQVMVFILSFIVFREWESAWFPVLEGGKWRACGA